MKEMPVKRSLYFVKMYFLKMYFVEMYFVEMYFPSLNMLRLLSWQPQAGEL